MRIVENENYSVKNISALCFLSELTNIGYAEYKKMQNLRLKLSK